MTGTEPTDSAKLRALLKAYERLLQYYYESEANYDRVSADLASALALLREVAESGVEFEDARVGYVSVQIDSEKWANLKSLLAKERP